MNSTPRKALAGRSDIEPGLRYDATITHLHKFLESEYGVRDVEIHIGPYDYGHHHRVSFGEPINAWFRIDPLRPDVDLIEDNLSKCGYIKNLCRLADLELQRKMSVKRFGKPKQTIGSRRR